MPEFLDLELSAFRCRIGGNGALGDHLAGYNGIWSLIPTGHNESLFVPAYAGLNLEHYFDGWHNGRREIFFEPRVAPMQVETHAAEQRVQLYQAPTPFWGVESTTSFTVREPNIVDLEFRCTPRRRVFNRDTLGVFWASYLLRPEDNALHFLAPGGPRKAPTRVRFASPRHGQESSVRGPADTYTLLVADEQRDKLFATVAPVRWARPYFYGRWRDQVVLMIFRCRHLLRFAMSPSGGGQGNPAWDFQFLAPEMAPGREYSLRARLVVDRWQGEEWVDRTATRWLDA